MKVTRLGLPFLGTILLLILSVAAPAVGQRSRINLDSIELPPGFVIELYSDDVPGARSLRLGEEGTVFVSTRREGRVYALVDEDGDFRPDRTYTILEDRYMPNGLAFRDGSLYVAEVNRVIRLDNIENRLDNPPEPVVVNDQFPDDRAHGWKYINFGPDGKLYVPVGAPCNVCEPPDWRYSTILRMNADGSQLEMYAEGIRNTVGFDWHPETGELWFTDNGRDWLGDNRPPDELNRIIRQGQHFGFPYVHGTDVRDPEFWAEHPEGLEMTTPVQELGPHVAALGMEFYGGTNFPQEYRGQIFIAEHGSWNRSVPIGYRVTLVRVEGNRAVSYEVFAEGWLPGEEGNEWGRPVDLLELPDGSLLVSDDKAGAVYRIHYDR